MIMMDYFNPTESRLADYKLNCKFQLDASAFSKRL